MIGGDGFLVSSLDHIIHVAIDLPNHRKNAALPDYVFCPGIEYSMGSLSMEHCKFGGVDVNRRPQHFSIELPINMHRNNTALSKSMEVLSLREPSRADSIELIGTLKSRDLKAHAINKERRHSTTILVSKSPVYRRHRRQIFTNMYTEFSVPQASASINSSKRKIESIRLNDSNVPCGKVVNTSKEADDDGGEDIEPFQQGDCSVDDDGEPLISDVLDDEDCDPTTRKRRSVDGYLVPSNEVDVDYSYAVTNLASKARLQPTSFQILSCYLYFCSKNARDSNNQTIKRRYWNPETDSFSFHRNPRGENPREVSDRSTLG
ncbi:hypothetical protein NC653_007788 [Populus alba x Populus x berolinensis]|uniref:Uncharacterized protein n=1 Tax=Populus alba x Populus x berolinensis TaxID=444605 RepID=A0AAD6R5Z8_9ROSI|nr:hypothetical protein NC653_007788 [Populus alba x Populus x berolinensis]